MNKPVRQKDSKDKFFSEISDILSYARKQARSAVNLSMVYAYYEIGKRIIEKEQDGNTRAKYGTKLLDELSEYLTKFFGKGFSRDNLENMRRFYLVYSKDYISETTSRKFTLSWSHYLRLSRISSSEERNFYEIEATSNNWSLREMNRQIGSALYERLALSKNKEEVLRLSAEGQQIETPNDVIKDPYILEFLGFPEHSSYTEHELESQIINNIESFLLELGKGFAFMGRQVRFTYQEDHFFVDLVFYNRLLKCFVLIDLKLDKLTHQDIGQMQMYVNYYDRLVKSDDENPTIGILLCKDKNDAVVEMTLPETNSQIYASKYKTVLPSKEELIKLLEDANHE